MAGGASGYQDEDSGGMISDINVTPLVDITLVLLIIFMVTAKLIVARGIDVDTPKTVSGDEVKTTLELTIKRDGQLYLNGEEVKDRAVITDYVERAIEVDPDLRPIITADIRVPHGDVMSVIDLIKVAGVKRFALTSEPIAE